MGVIRGVTGPSRSYDTTSVRRHPPGRVRERLAWAAPAGALVLTGRACAFSLSKSARQRSQNAWRSGSGLGLSNRMAISEFDSATQPILAGWLPQLRPSGRSPVLPLCSCRRVFSLGAPAHSLEPLNDGSDDLHG